MKGKTLTYWNYGMAEQYFLDKGFKLVNMKSADEKFHTKQKITLCDDEGYYYYSTQNNISRNNPSKFDVSNPYTIDNIRKWCLDNNKDFMLLSDSYVGYSKKLMWQCLRENCQEVYASSWQVISGGSDCPFCAGQKIGKNNCLATRFPELVKEFHPIKNNDITPYNIGYGSNRKVWWVCSKNPKHEWQTSIGNRARRNSGCPYCSGDLPSDDNNLFVHNEKLCEEWNYDKNKKFPQDYCQFSNKKVWWKCKECNHEWLAKINDRNGRNANACPECSFSKGEIKIKEFLMSNAIVYCPQKEFDGLIGTRNGKLSYDFYLPSLNLLVEYQGEFHDGNVNKNIQPISKLKRQQEHDRRKRDYAKTNNINLLEIWYWDFDNIEEILSKTLQINKNII